jgi:glucose-1-phosphate cytidylyltransferase
VKVVILAGGLGTRLSEETAARPKPMVEIGGKPILLHLMQLYSNAGFREFVVACGYRQEVIKDYFRSLYAINNDLTVDFATGEIDVHVRQSSDWKVHLIDTGSDTMTGGRIKRLAPLIGEETFMCTYGDGLASIDAADLLEFHKKCKRQATVTGVRPPSRFGVLKHDGDRVTSFSEKPQVQEGWINGGFFVFEPSIFERITGDDTLLEHEPLVGLAAEGQLSIYLHEGFWHPMDTLRDKRLLEELWASGAPPWMRSTSCTIGEGDARSSPARPAFSDPGSAKS